MKQPSFITLTFCALVFGCFATANATSEEPVASKYTHSFSSLALLSGDTYSWTGIYIGGNVGGILNYYQLNANTVALDPIQQFNTAFSEDGEFSAGQTGVDTFLFTPHRSETDGSVMGGGQIGAMYQFGHFVVGIEGDFDRLATHAKKTFFGTDVSLFSNGDPDDDVLVTTDFTSDRKVDTNWNASLRARLGWAHGAFLFYATGGVAWTDVQVTANDAAFTTFGDRFDTSTAPPGVIPAGPTPPPFFTAAAATSRNFHQGDDKTYTGWTAGAGTAIAVTDTISIGLEYRHSDYGGETHNIDAHGGPIFSTGQSIDLESDQVTLRFNVALNRFFGH